MLCLMVNNEDEPEDVIVRDSIIENKERTKSYWEQLMMAAAAESQRNSKIRGWETTDTSISQANGNKTFKNSFNVAINSLNCSSNNIYKECIENCNSEKPRHCIKADISSNPMPMEDRIALELQEQREREEELKRFRRQLSLESSKEVSSLKDLSNVIEEVCSIHTNDDSNYSEYGSEEKEHSLDENNSRVNTPYSDSFVHRRTQSLDSVSSGLSSGSGSILNEKDSPRRKVMVRPYEDPQEEEEVPAYKRSENETPIEREIRITKEREEELRKEKGIHLNVKQKAEQPKILSLNKKDAVENDPRDVQHRLATNRIQHEIEEANERENELRTEGKILTTSEETVDAKVTRFTQLAEYAILENRHKGSKMKRSLSVSQLTEANSENRYRNSSRAVEVMESRDSRKFNPNNAQKGIMQRFIATKGKMSLAAVSADLQSTSNNRDDRPKFLHSSTSSFESFNKSASRKGYVSAEEKIQEELKEMEKREKELRLQRGYIQPSRHRSQPNLLNLVDDSDCFPGSDDEDGEPHSWTSHKETRKLVPRLSYSLSNPSLLDDGLGKVNVRLPNKRFSLLQQWESRIQSAQ